MLNYQNPGGGDKKSGKDKNIVSHKSDALEARSKLVSTFSSRRESHFTSTLPSLYSEMPPFGHTQVR